MMYTWMGSDLELSENIHDIIVNNWQIKKIVLRLWKYANTASSCYAAATILTSHVLISTGYNALLALCGLQFLNVMFLYGSYFSQGPYNHNLVNNIS